MALELPSGIKSEFLSGSIALTKHEAEQQVELDWDSQLFGTLF